MRTLFVIFLLIVIVNSYSQEQFSIYFDSNKSDLKKTEHTRLHKWIYKNKQGKIIGAYGFCDEDGSTGFNDTLAKKRIDCVFNSIKNKIKFREDFKSRSFGELNNTSKIKAENRKVTLFFIQPKDFARENDIIALEKLNQKKLASKNNNDLAANDKMPVKKTYENLKFPDKLIFENPDGTKSEMRMDTVFMKQINLAKAGEKLKIDNLNFIINTFAVVNESRAKMFELFFVMKNNPNLKIEIQGNLCCAKNDKLDLSTQRARAIYNFLVNKNIDKSRLSFKGFGVSQPIFAIPEQNEFEREENRRVEILILEN